MDKESCVQNEKVIWRPSQQTIDNANVTRFIKKHQLATVDDLLKKSVEDVEWFWKNSVEEVGIQWFQPYEKLLSLEHGFSAAEWFLNGQINIVTNCLDRHALHADDSQKIALVWQGECGALKQITYQELHEQTNQVANYLKSIGVVAGDRVALYLPMIAELLPIFYACFKIGAVLVPIFSGFGTDSVLVRFDEAQVKVVFTADGTLRGGKKILLKSMLNEVLEKSQTVTHCLVVERLFEKNTPMKSGRDFFYDSVMTSQSKICATAALPSEHHSMIIFTSGTTGKPKGTIHTHAGVLAQVTKEFYFHFDFKKHDVFFWVTDIGWMMGPWEIIGTHHFAGTLVLIEGAPYYPQSHRVLQVSQDFNVTHLGVSPTLIRFLIKENVKLIPLPSLKIMGSTGEAWDDDSYLWCFHHIGKSRVPIMNISGGTEIMGCLLAPLPVKELKACSLQGPGLAMDVDIYNEEGHSVALGEVGYLVCKQPGPSMTKGFLNDRARYLDTYFSKFKNVWNHGDWAVQDEDGQWFLRGRSDDTIKIAGKRTGPAEIESVLCSHPFVLEACAVGIPDTLKGQALICFVVLKNKNDQSQELLVELKKLLGEKLGKIMSPQQIYFVEALAKTRSGKIVRGVIQKKYLGQEIKDVSSLENPALLDLLPTVSA